MWATGHDEVLEMTHKTYCACHSFDVSETKNVAVRIVTNFGLMMILLVVSEFRRISGDDLGWLELPE